MGTRDRDTSVVLVVCTVRRVIVGLLSGLDSAWGGIRVGIKSTFIFDNVWITIHTLSWHKIFGMCNFYSYWFGVPVYATQSQNCGMWMHIFPQVGSLGVTRLKQNEDMDDHCWLGLISEWRGCVPGWGHNFRITSCVAWRLALLSTDYIIIIMT